jgi:DNA-directed RNA polymerase subunit H (RpoH/RPB5)
MNQIHVEVSEVIEARPEEIYAILADYRVGHPAILPKPYFTDLVVKEGGQGAGTIVRVGMKVMGKAFAYQQVISEPDPGRVLMEEDAAAGVTTTFTVEPLDGSSRSRVTIATDAAVSPGATGWLERVFNPPVMRRIYQQELQQLAEYVRRP